MLTLEFINNGQTVGEIESGIFFSKDEKYVGFYAKQFAKVFADSLSVPVCNISIRVTNQKGQVYSL